MAHPSFLSVLAYCNNGIHASMHAFQRGEEKRAWPRLLFPLDCTSRPHYATPISEYGVTILGSAGAPSLTLFKGGVLGLIPHPQRTETPVRTSERLPLEQFLVLRATCFCLGPPRSSSLINEDRNKSPSLPKQKSGAPAKAASQRLGHPPNFKNHGVIP